jgi:hypothetical protein
VRLGEPGTYGSRVAVLIGNHIQRFESELTEQLSDDFDLLTTELE